jgi:hypothetical protein
VKIRAILGALVLLVSVQANADIINATNTNTEYAPSLNADLQELEWLSLDETLGQSVDSILGGYGGYIGQGWRYANREETAILLNSLSGGVSGLSNDPVVISGASWFMENIANDDRYLTYWSLYSYFIYTDLGDDVPCITPDSPHYCLGRLSTQNHTMPNVSGAITAAWFRDDGGLDDSITVSPIYPNESNPLYGSLLVRPAPTPPTIVDSETGFRGLVSSVFTEGF